MVVVNGGNGGEWRWLMVVVEEDDDTIVFTHLLEGIKGIVCYLFLNNKGSLCNFSNVRIFVLKVNFRGGHYMFSFSLDYYILKL